MRNDMHLKFQSIIRSLYNLDNEIVEQIRTIPIGLYDTLRYDDTIGCGGILGGLECNVAELYFELLQIPYTDDNINKLDDLLNENATLNEKIAISNYLKIKELNDVDTGVIRFIDTYLCVEFADTDQLNGVLDSQLYKMYQEFCVVNEYFQLPLSGFCEKFINYFVTFGFKFVETTINGKIHKVAHFEKVDNMQINQTHQQMRFSKNEDEFATQICELCSKGIEYLKDCYLDDGKAIYSSLIEIGLTDEQIVKLGDLIKEGDEL